LYLWLLKIWCGIVNSLFKRAFWYCEKCSTHSNHSKSITIKSSSHLPYFLVEKFTSFVVVHNLKKKKKNIKFPFQRQILGPSHEFTKFDFFESFPYNDDNNSYSFHQLM
jgi:hypothetical protein